MPPDRQPEDHKSERRAKRYPTIADVAAEVELCTATVRRAIDDGELEASQLASGKWRTTWGAVDAWMARKSTRPRRRRRPVPAARGGRRPKGTLTVGPGMGRR